MPESSLALSNAQIREELAFFIGFGRDADVWTDEQKATLKAFVDSGLRNAYLPGPAQGLSVSYEWSFLRPTWETVLPSSATALSLPDDYGGMDGMIYYAGTDSALPAELPLVNEGVIFSKKSLLPNATGRPIMASIRPLRNNSPTHGQRFELIFWPTPGQDYTLRMTYFVLPDALTDARPYPYGGMAFAETVLESCLAVAEQRLDDTMGIHSAKFQERLSAAIAADRRYKASEFGYNGDRSDRMESRWANRYPHGWSSVTVYGTPPS